VDQTASWLKQFGIWTIVVSLLLSMGISILGIVPSLFLSGANADAAHSFRADHFYRGMFHDRFSSFSAYYTGREGPFDCFGDAHWTRSVS